MGLATGRVFGVSAFAATIAASFWSAGPAFIGELSAQKDVKTYLPIHSISYEFGSKAISGYFVKHGSICLVTLMIHEKGDLDRPRLSTAARVRLLLDPGQIAGLDSEEGRSINLTCDEGAQTLRVEVGDRNRLIELQSLMSYDDFRRPNSKVE